MKNQFINKFLNLRILMIESVVPLFFNNKGFIYLTKSINSAFNLTINSNTIAKTIEINFF